jgi:hypothetical protein
MNRALVTLRLTAALAMTTLSAGALAQAEVPLKATCQTIGTVASEPLGDPAGHAIRVVEYSCRGEGGVTDGTTITGMVIWEVDGPNSVALDGNGVYRKTGGIAVYQDVDAKYTLTVVDGKVTGFSGTSKVIIKAAGGGLASLAGKSFTESFHSIPGGQFVLERTPN